MKTAEEWADKINDILPALMEPIPCSTVENIVKQIQLDAWKQGMSDATDLVITNNPLGVFKLAETLVNERENKTSI